MRCTNCVCLSGYFIRATRNDKWNVDFDASNPPASPRLVGTTSGYLRDHYTSHDVGKLQPQNLRIQDLNWIEESVRCLCLCRIPVNPSCTNRPYNRCHSGSNSNCKVIVNGSLSRLHVVTHVQSFLSCSSRDIYW